MDANLPVNFVSDDHLFNVSIIEPNRRNISPGCLNILYILCFMVCLDCGPDEKKIVSVTSKYCSLQCGLRSGHFGQGVFVDNLLSYFLNNPAYRVTLVYTDEKSVTAPLLKIKEHVSILLIPSLIGQQLLSGELQPAQQYNAVLFEGIVYEQLRTLEKPIFWVNSIDFINVCRE